MASRKYFAHSVLTIAFPFLATSCVADEDTSSQFSPHESSLAAAVGDQVIDPDVGEARLMSDIRQLTFEGRRSGEGYFSHDGTKMIFQSERDPQNPFFQIFVLDLETGDLERMSLGIGKTTCPWFHPSDQKVLFASTHDDPHAVAKQEEEIKNRAAGKQKRYAWDYDEHYDIYERSLDNDLLRKLTYARGYDAEASWSPDGQWIVFASNRHAYTEPLSPEDAKAFEIDKSLMMDIYMMDAEGGHVRRLTDVKGYDGGPFFRPDGRRICWRRFSEDGATAEIFTMNADGSDHRQITHMGVMSWAPYYHPSSGYFIFTTNKHGFDNFELYMVDVEGRSEPVRVTYTPDFDGLPTFSDDGARITWTSRRTSRKDSQIFVADWNHQAARRLLGVEQILNRQAASRSMSSIAASLVTTPDINAEDARAHVEVLASERMEGRLTGSEGERLATQYAAETFERLGLVPDGDNGTYFQHFDFTAGASLGPANSLRISGIEPDRADAAGLQESPGRGAFEVDKDWRPLGISNTGQFESAEIVFAGYGISAPKTDDFEGYESFTHLDVENKFVIVLRDMPEDLTPERRQHLVWHATRSAKARTVRDRGAVGLMVVSGPNSQFRDELVPIRRGDIHAAVSIPAISVTARLGQRILAKAGKQLEDLQAKLDTGQPQMGFAIPGIRIEMTIDIHKVTRQGRNVVARLPAGPGKAAQGALVIGAHIDHLGRGGSANSLAREGEKDQIHYGADDNASGVAGLLEIAEYFVDQAAAGKLELERDVVFGGWSGEELGLLGSKHYVSRMAAGAGLKDSIQPAVAAYLNMDMIGRLDKKLIVQGVGSSSIWPGEVERRNVPVGLSISIQQDATLPTDATSFYKKGVPVLSVFTGAHSEYHSPRDTPEKLNYPGLAKVARFTSLVARSIATSSDPPDYILVPDEKQSAGRMLGRAYLGTMPDYAGEVRGTLLSSVTKGAPADKAGMKGGDIIVELAGRRIENVYDYTDAIGALKVGQPTEIIVLRGGKRLKLTITPGSRE